MLPLHRSSINRFYEIQKVLLDGKGAYPLRMIRRAKVNFHVLSVEEEDHGGENRDAKVLDILWDCRRVDTVEGSHLGESDGGFGNL